MRTVCGPAARSACGTMSGVPARRQPPCPSTAASGCPPPPSSCSRSPCSWPAASRAAATKRPRRRRPAVSARSPRATSSLPASTMSTMRTGTQLTPAVQEYLEALYWLGEAGIECSPINLARAMQVSPPSVTEMVRRMETDGLVGRGPGKRIALTDEGERVARHVVSRHRLVEAFLVKVMGVPWDEVHEEAEAFEMGVTEALEARM